MRLRAHTWHYETAFVVLALSGVLILTGAPRIEWLGMLAVLVGFQHACITDRLAEREATREQPIVPCYWKARWFFVGKEILWAGYFFLRGSYAALVGCAIFFAYPFWRRWYRAWFPLDR